MGDLIKFAGEVSRMPMGQVPAVGQVHGENLVARFYGGKVNGHVSLRSAVRLNVDVFRAEESLGPVDGELLRDIDIFAAAIPPFPRISFGILVSQNAALRFHDRPAREILRSDQFDILTLPFFFRTNDIEDLRIDAAKRFAVNARWCPGWAG